MKYFNTNHLLDYICFHLYTCLHKVTNGGDLNELSS